MNKVYYHFFLKYNKSWVLEVIGASIIIFYLIYNIYLKLKIHVFIYIYFFIKILHCIY